MLLRRELIKTLTERFPDRLQEIIPPAPRRSFLKDRRSGLLIEVRIARTFTVKRDGSRWFIDRYKSSKTERRRITILALLDEQNTDLKELRVFRNMNFPGKNMRVGVESHWLQSGESLENISGFFEAIRYIRRTN
jgi:hypothetical protein